MYQDSLYALCCKLSEQYSRELTEDEIIKSIHIYKFPAIIGATWSFTGHFYKWPETLLTRSDIPDTTRQSLEENLRDELGYCGTPPHTQMFIETARSMGVSLDETQSPGDFMIQTLKNARELPANKAIGAFLANESQAKWGGFMKVFSNQPGINMDFFKIHTSETHHSQPLLAGFVEEDIPGLLSGVIEFSKSRAVFMNSIRDQLIDPVSAMNERNNCSFPEQFNY
ncbi:iron-containing redox enzyme family protein [Endozoicomonas arenosclerae]|uniref:iron-containing redox enzyme family protein n=1 Tax=Endozoicomonas arenosclerae TaxID=1633495 RepID=UPI000785834E|nr:iron-containing redox enzyme family protein [Endozoicomonas arenosclerae]